MENPKINPCKELVVGVLTCIHEELQLPKLNLHIADRVLRRMALCGELNGPGWTSRDIVHHADIGGCKTLAVGSERHIQIDEERDSGRNKLGEVMTIDIQGPKLARDPDERGDKRHH
jgi:hypothetical protein